MFSLKFAKNGFVPIILLHLSMGTPPGRLPGPKKKLFDTFPQLRTEPLLIFSVGIFGREGSSLTFSNVHNFKCIFRLTGPIILFFLTPATRNCIPTN